MSSGADMQDEAILGEHTTMCTVMCASVFFVFTVVLVTLHTHESMYVRVGVCLCVCMCLRVCL